MAPRSLVRADAPHRPASIAQVERNPWSVLIPYREPWTVSAEPTRISPAHPNWAAWLRIRDPSQRRRWSPPEGGRRWSSNRPAVLVASANAVAGSGGVGGRGARG